MIKVKGIKEVIRKINEQTDREIEAVLKFKLRDVRDDLVEATPIDTGKARRGWTIKGKTLENSVSYIDDLNKGSSRQAPAYFIEKTVLSHPGVKPNGVIVRYK